MTASCSFKDGRRTDGRVDEQGDAARGEHDRRGTG